ncbi:hypothetical protein [Endozoicomonas ascidiicola]|uniref:hypothetical protein n=1 Tax=Endozoicomonas ascidiicola TaxID=1698521 RepID=UPI0008331129|nr:hypothetical protein [Endozoicomonas ascidiicola]
MRGPKGLHLIPCEDCNGSGEHRSTFDYQICIGCNGLGEVRSDNQQPLDDYQIINRLRERNRQLLIKVNQLKQLHSKPQPTDQEIKRKHRGVLAS